MRGDYNGDVADGRRRAGEKEWRERCEGLRCGQLRGKGSGLSSPNARVARASTAHSPGSTALPLHYVSTNSNQQRFDGRSLRTLFLCTPPSRSFVSALYSANERLQRMQLR